MFRPILQLQGSFMLVLMRKAGESIHIGPNIVVTLVSLERNRARIGIQAPRDIVIDREEIAEKKRTEGLLTQTDEDPPNDER
jgi:carbon storage regulator